VKVKKFSKIKQVYIRGEPSETLGGEGGIEIRKVYQGGSFVLENQVGALQNSH